MPEGATVISDVSREPRSLNDLLRQLIQIGIALTNERDLSTLLDRILTDPGLREDLVRRGRARAGEFSWKRSGSLQVAAYEQAVA